MRQSRFQVAHRKDWGKVEAPHPNHVWQSDMTKVWGRAQCGLGVSGLGDRLLILITLDSDLPVTSLIYGSGVRSLHQVWRAFTGSARISQLRT
jgi:hypothetical protein